MEAIDDMEFEWDEREQQFLRVFLGKILKRPYAAAWNTWLEMVASQKLYEEQQRRRKIIKRMAKVLDNQVPGKRDDKGMDKIKAWALEVHGDIFLKLKPGAAAQRVVILTSEHPRSSDEFLVHQVLSFVPAGLLSRTGYTIRHFYQ